MRGDIREGGRSPTTRSRSIRRGQLCRNFKGAAMVLHFPAAASIRRSIDFFGIGQGYPEFRKAYTRLVLISTDNQLNINEFSDAFGATWPFLSDPGRMIQKDLDIKEFTDEPHDPIIPQTFVLEPRPRYSRSTTATGTGAVRRWPGFTWTSARSSRRFAGLRPGSPGIEGRLGTGRSREFLVDTLEAPIRYTEGASGSNADQCGRASKRFRRPRGSSDGVGETEETVTCRTPGSGALPRL